MTMNSSKDRDALYLHWSMVEETQVGGGPRRGILAAFGVACTSVVWLKLQDGARKFDKISTTTR